MKYLAQYHSNSTIYPLIYDQITNRSYFNITDGFVNDDLREAIDYDNFAIGYSGGYARFFLQDRTLVIVKTEDPINLYQSLMKNSLNADEDNRIKQSNVFDAFFWIGHSDYEFECNNCKDGESYKKSDIECTKERAPINIKFYLNDLQAQTFYVSSNQPKNYKHIDFVQDCHYDLVKNFEKIGFKHHLTEYFADQELLIKEGGVWEFIHRSYKPENVTDPERAIVSAYAESVLGSDFRDEAKWSMVRCQDLDLDKAMSNQDISNRITETYKIRAEYYPKIIQTVLAQSSNHNLSDENITTFGNILINKSITYENLYYTYVLKIYYQIVESFKNIPEVINLLEVFDELVSTICVSKIDFHDNDGKVIASTGAKYNSDECRNICELTKGLTSDTEYECGKFDLVQKTVVEEIVYLGNVVNE